MNSRGLPPPGRRAPRVARAPRASAPWWHGGLLWLLMLATLPLVNPHVRSDGNEYYAYVRSIVIDHDLNFDNEYARAEDTFQAAMTGELGISPAGHRRNIASVGPSLLWTPFFLAAHAAVHVMQLRGQSVPADGYSWPYLWACAGGTAFYAFLGLWLSYRLALRFAAPNAALFATIAIWLASSLPVYLYFLPFHAHAMAMFSVAWFLWNWFQVRDGSDGRGRWFVWGLSAGLVVATYYLNGLVLLAALIECLLRAFKPRQFVPTVIGGLVFSAGLVLVVLPGFLIKGWLDGSLLATGYGGELFFWRDPRLLAVGFAAEHGAFLWTPILLAAVLGFAWLIRRTPLVGSIVVLTFAVFYYAVASYRAWHGHSSYGSRFLVALTPFFIFGLAALVEGICGTHRRRWLGAWAAAIVLVAWNAGFMLQWGTNLVPNRGPVDFRVVVRNQVTVVPRAGWDFLRRYFRQRDALVHDVERADVPERSRYDLKR
jgi:hypothetical protein